MSVPNTLLTKTHSVVPKIVTIPDFKCTVGEITTSIDGFSYLIQIKWFQYINTTRCIIMLDVD